MVGLSVLLLASLPAILPLGHKDSRKAISRLCCTTQSSAKPTREDHVPDLVLCTKAGLIRGNVEVCDKLGSSNHWMVSFEIDARSKNNQGVIKKPDLRRADFWLLRELASHADPTFPEHAGANVCFNIFKEWLETLCDRCIPKRRVRRGHQSTKPLWWMDPGWLRSFA